MHCPRCTLENAEQSRYCNGCGLLLRQETKGPPHPATDASTGDAAPLRRRAGREHAVHEPVPGVRRAARQAAAPLRRIERRRQADRRLAQRREPYLGETGAPPAAQSPETPYPPPSPARRAYGWLTAAGLLLIACTAGMAAWVWSNPAQALQAAQGLEQVARMVGLNDHNLVKGRVREAGFGTSLEELPYDGKAPSSFAEERQVVTPQTSTYVSDRPGKIAETASMNASSTESSIPAGSGGRAEKAEADRIADAAKTAGTTSGQEESQKPAVVVQAKPAVKARPKASIPPSLARDRELNRLQMQANREGTD